MGLLNFFKKSPQKPQKRFYTGANRGNLSASWTTSSLSADNEIRQSISLLRARARDLVRNNAHAQKYINLLKQNVIGTGIKLQNKAQDDNKTLDKYANDLIEQWWSDFCKVGNCDVTQTLDFAELQKLILASVATDGEVFIRVVKNYDNKHKFALQLIESDLLDENYNDQQLNITMGIERDSWGKVVAYHLYKSHPYDYMQQSLRERVRISADEIIHLYKKERPSQSRGVTWFHSVMGNLKMYDGFAEASLVEKRLTASKMGFYKRPQGEEYYGDNIDEAGNIINEATPAQFEILPEGWDFQAFDPKSGNDNFVDFGKAILRNISSGLNVSYSSLASDLEGVNYSSIRAGLLDERDAYKSLQSWFIEHFMKVVFSQWIETQLVYQNISLPLSKLSKFNNPMFIGRGFAWVDPQKDVKANTEAIANGLKTATQVLSEQGLDVEEVYQQLAKEKELRVKYKIDTQTDINLQGKNNEIKKPV